MKTVQIGTIGAMQRAHPALTRLWLRWTGIPGIEHASFDMARTETGINPATKISLRAREGTTRTWEELCNVLSFPEDAAERRSMPIFLTAKDPAHGVFWERMLRREAEEVDGPLEWWWRLFVLRCKGVQRASKILIREAIGDFDHIDNGLLSFTNPSLLLQERPSDPLIAGMYSQPTHVVVSLRIRRGERIDGLSFDLSSATFKSRFVTKLVELAVSRSE